MSILNEKTFSPRLNGPINDNNDKDSVFFYDNHYESIFDDEKLFPIPNHSSIIKFDEKNTQLINVANIKAIIVHLTSPEVIDYNFIYDFFLTYRSFINSERVLNLLITRFIWSLQYINSTDQINVKLGKLVLLRTFVVLRHWLLNYFSDDFANNLNLRKIFVENFNGLSNSNLFSSSMIFEIKIFNDLKSHWINIAHEFYNIKLDYSIPKEDLLQYKLSAYDSATNELHTTLTQDNIENDPSYRRSVMLSLYDSKVHHRLPIPDSKIIQPSITKLLLQHKSSKISITPTLNTTEINELSNSASSKTLSSSLSTLNNATNHLNSYLNPKNSSLSLKKVLCTKNLPSRTNTNFNNTKELSEGFEFKRLSCDLGNVKDFGFSISGNIKMPDSKIKEILPPTPVKRLTFNRVKSYSKEDDIIEMDEKTYVNRKNSLRKLIDGWKTTFSNTKKDKRNQDDNELKLLFSNAINVISDTTITEEGNDDNDLSIKIDILSARIIDELEYIIKFYLNSKTQNDERIDESGELDDTQIRSSIETPILVDVDIHDDYIQDSPIEEPELKKLVIEIPEMRDNFSSNSSITDNFKTPNLYENDRFEDFHTPEMYESAKFGNDKESDDEHVVETSGENISEGNAIIVEHMAERNSSAETFESLLDINDLSELNINKIDGIVNKKSGEIKLGSSRYRDSFQIPTQISWNDDNELDFDNSNTDSNGLELNTTSLSDEFENTQDLNFTGFSDIMDSQTDDIHANNIQKIANRAHKRLRPKLIKLKTEFLAEKGVPEDPNGNFPSLPSSSTIGNRSLHSENSSVDGEDHVNNFNSQNARHISFDEVNLANNRFSIRPSINHRSSHISVKSYMSYDSDLSFSNSDINYNYSTDNSKGSDLLKKKAGFNNLRSALPDDAMMDFKFQSTSSIIEPPSEVSTSDLHEGGIRLSTDLPYENPQHQNIKRLSIFSNNSIFNSEGPLIFKSQDPDTSVDHYNINHLKERLISHQRMMSEDSRHFSASTTNHNSGVFPGISNAILRELAAIPDQHFNQDDPIAWALSKLEGKDAVEEPIARSSQINLAGDESLYNSDVETTEDILKAINNANTEDYSELTDDEITPKLEPITPISHKRVSSMANRRISVFNTEIFGSSPNITQGNNTSPQVVLGNYQMSSDLLSIQNIMENNSHISFILSYDSNSLANHFTVIEKDMLLEIDWKELIELKWNKDLVPINSWLEILVNTERNKGVDLVISRFNLMVNWIISEILLTKFQTERRDIISRFIHIAQNCYNLQNFSTLMQIILALTSEKITKLKETWKTVPPADISTLNNLESIMSPLQNFINLRFSMNKIQPSRGCIPFVGLYLSDLTFNAERPIYIKFKEEKKIDDFKDLLPPTILNEGESPTPITSINQDEKLINFSRFRTSAAIVKSLSQCIEWSQLYNLNPDHELLSKCLYVKSLPEEEMYYCLQEMINP